MCISKNYLLDWQKNLYVDILSPKTNYIKVKKKSMSLEVPVYSDSRIVLAKYTRKIKYPDY